MLPGFLGIEFWHPSLLRPLQLDAPKTRSPQNKAGPTNSRRNLPLTAPFSSAFAFIGLVKDSPHDSGCSSRNLLSSKGMRFLPMFSLRWLTASQTHKRQMMGLAYKTIPALLLFRPKSHWCAAGAIATMRAAKRPIRGRETLISKHGCRDNEAKNPTWQRNNNGKWMQHSSDGSLAGGT